MSQTVDKECAWLEAISVFQQLRKGNYQAGVDALCLHKGAGVKGEGVEGTGVEGAKLAGQSEYSQNRGVNRLIGWSHPAAVLIRHSIAGDHAFGAFFTNRPAE